MDIVTRNTQRMVMEVAGLTRIIDALIELGYEVHAPFVRDEVVATRRFVSGDELPVGFRSEQAPGSYRLSEDGGRTRFGWAVGPQTWKPLVHPTAVQTMTMSQPGRDQPVTVSVPGRPRQPVAMFGMRPCDLAALEKLDNVLLDSAPTPEPLYRARRDDAFIVVVNCGVPAATCFCSSVGTGPHVDGRSTSHDIELTELVDDSVLEPHYAVTAVSQRGEDLLATVAETVATRPMAEADVEAVRRNAEGATRAMNRHLDSDRAANSLRSAHRSDRWDLAAQQCVACGNCTAVCPTCFCTTIDDVGDLGGTQVARWRHWESCFSLEFSRLGGEVVRSSLASRYRQWMTHKLSTWHDQFGESGCVGCGRCTTWCPVGIDFVDVAQGFIDDAEGAMQ